MSTSDEPLFSLYNYVKYSSFLADLTTSKNDLKDWIHLLNMSLFEILLNLSEDQQAALFFLCSFLLMVFVARRCLAVSSAVDAWYSSSVPLSRSSTFRIFS